MTVFIAHVEADQDAADDLKAHLKSRGMLAETETGARGFRFVQRGDVVVALWSQKSVFGSHRLMLEKRMLDAWADEQLVLVKLDHGILPVGVRDLPAVDASFAQSRALVAWAAVERQVREKMRAAYAPPEPPVQPLPPGGSMSGSTGGSPAGGFGAGGADDAFSAPRDSVASAPQAPTMSAPPMPAPARAKGSMWPLLAAFAGVVAIGAIVAYLFTPSSPTAGGDAGDGGVLVLIGLGALVLIGALVLALRSRASQPAVKKSAPISRAPASAPAREAEAAAPRPAPAPAPVAAEPVLAALFVSYAHADDAAVAPVVRAVEASGRTVWIDKGGIQAGEGWAGEIVRGIKGAKGVIVMCSPRAFESDHIKREVYLADRYKKPMLPVFLEAAQPPEDFEYFFAGVQWLELFKVPEAERSGAIGKALAGV
jgi:hypothetical protein